MKKFLGIVGLGFLGGIWYLMVRTAEMAIKQEIEHQEQKKRVKNIEDMTNSLVKLSELANKAAEKKA